jgi:hypothetical protein
MKHLAARWYHAGVEKSQWDITWSYHSRRSFEAAAEEARRMSRRHGGRPLVEWWTGHGPQPGDCEVVEGAEYVDERRETDGA